MRVLTKEPGLNPGVVEVDGLESMQGLVGGYIQVIPLHAYNPGLEEANIDLFCNEEGKMNSLPPNFNLVDPTTGEIHDIVVGDAFFCRHDEEGGSLSLRDEDIKAICDLFEWQVPEAA